jgi:hypothetical protein
VSSDVEGGLNYSRLKRFYDAYDFVTMPFSATMDYYTSGAMGFINNQNVFDPLKGWSLHPHGQARAPLFFGFVPWPSPAPAFEGKHWRFRSTRTALVRFGDVRNVPIVLPAAQTLEFWQRSYIVFVRTPLAFGTAGTLSLFVEG